MTTETSSATAEAEIREWNRRSYNYLTPFGHQVGWGGMPGPRRQGFGVPLQFGGLTLLPADDYETCVNPFARGERS